MNKILKKLIGKIVTIECNKEDPRNSPIYLIADNIKIKVNMEGQGLKIEKPEDNSLFCESVRLTEVADTDGVEMLDLVLYDENADKIIAMSAFGYSENSIESSEE